jgi:tetratricopeptide (TPR) repeat protein
MGLDYSLWKWKDDPPAMSAGLCYLLLAEGLESPAVVPLDEERLIAQIGAEFPDIWTQSEPVLCEVAPLVVRVEGSFSVAGSVLDWFEAFAEREGLHFFDPQDKGSISKDDRKEVRRRQLVLYKREAADRQERELAELRRRCAEGDGKAYFELGNRFSFGEGVRKNPREAFAHFQKSADLGCGDGMFNLAACYRNGEGVPRDIAQAIAWYERASESDRSFGPLALGEIYANGETGTVDREKALHYLRLSWEQGNRQARKLLEELGDLPPEALRGPESILAGLVGPGGVWLGGT